MSLVWELNGMFWCVFASDGSVGGALAFAMYKRGFRRLKKRERSPELTDAIIGWYHSYGIEEGPPRECKAN